MNDKSKKKRGRRGIQSIDTGIRLLEVLQNADGPMPLKDLSARSDMDPSSAHRYLASFVRSGLVRHYATAQPAAYLEWRRSGTRSQGLEFGRGWRSSEAVYFYDNWSRLPKRKSMGNGK